MTAPRLMRGLMAAVIALPLALLGACGGDDNSSSDGKTELTFFWWGGEARAKLTEQALALYTQKHPDVTFKTTWQANQGYFDKLATLTAGSDAPDIFQIDDNYLAEYATRNVTLDLTSYKDSGKVDVSKFPEGLWKYGVVDNKLAGLAMGENTQGLVFNKTKLEAAKQELPKTGISWADFITWAQKAGAATKIPGTQDPSADYKAFWVWLRQNGKDLYNGNQLAFTKDDVQKWFELWKGARDTKATPTADVIHEGNATDITKQLVVTNKALTSWVWANQMPDIQKNTKDELAVVAYPGDPSAQWARASMYFSVYRGSKDKDKAVDVINFLANDPEAAKILGTDRGLPSNLDNRTAVAATVTDPAMKASIALEDELVKKFGPAPSVPPKGHSTVKSELIKAAEAAQFGTATPDKAAEQFFAAAQAAVAG
ncbi:multiple sugar transport system substrate-binding protein [Actinoplanes octamycinicus]|uniref:Multiple sugar transport system substrate-binding protein n=1 Tax=Actinoplanes octamycinicus TaxID=135948 RepID=A0A7W7H619_9ACTN|nr:extracellular solute-binding protein [Actinoplanes octamycinicus]MBB4744651.1 multiple sugar transport system substrate-binding protein [Actinoplanes octamycinicus]GIE55232.1 sugar ABC transporter substrate-binding protein [Actinoplanes octamycinicus]